MAPGFLTSDCSESKIVIAVALPIHKETVPINRETRPLLEAAVLTRGSCTEHVSVRGDSQSCFRHGGQCHF